MSYYSRRDFVKAGLAAGALASVGTCRCSGARTATDWVTLGKSGVKVTRLAFGTGTMSGQVQRELGQTSLPGWCAMPMTTAFASSRRRIVWRDATDAGRCAEGIPRESYQYHDQGDDARTGRSAGEARRAAQDGDRVFRHHAAALAAHGDVAD